MDIADDRSQVSLFENKNTRNTVNTIDVAHTKLLTRLKLEKAQAQLSINAPPSKKDGMTHGQKADQDPEPDNGCPSGTSSSATLCFKAKDGLPIKAEEQVHGLADALLDGGGEGKAVLSLKAQREQNDPESASGCVARVKEAQLKAKLRAAHLRARLAAENRLLDE